MPEFLRRIVEQIKNVWIRLKKGPHFSIVPKVIMRSQASDIPSALEDRRRRCHVPRCFLHCSVRDPDDISLMYRSDDVNSAALIQGRCVAKNIIP